MNLLQNVQSVDKLHALILQKNTGTPKELAQRLGISRSNLYILIDELNGLNLTIGYSRKLETFYYEKEEKIKPLFNQGLPIYAKKGI